MAYQEECKVSRGKNGWEKIGRTEEGSQNDPEFLQQILDLSLQYVWIWNPRWGKNQVTIRKNLCDNEGSTPTNVPIEEFGSFIWSYSLDGLIWSVKDRIGGCSVIRSIVSDVLIVIISWLLSRKYAKNIIKFITQPQKQSTSPGSIKHSYDISPCHKQQSEQFWMHIRKAVRIYLPPDHEDTLSSPIRHRHNPMSYHPYQTLH